MEPSVQIALITLVGTVVTAGAVVGVAFVNRSGEKKATAEGAVEMTLRERIILKDELLSEERADNAALRDELAIERVARETAERESVKAVLRAEAAERENERLWAEIKSTRGETG